MNATFAPSSANFNAIALPIPRAAPVIACNSTIIEPSSLNEVSVGSKGKERKITNVGDGVVSNTSTDAVTGRQLFSGDGIDTAAWKAKLGVGSGGSGGAIDAYTKNEADNKFANKTDLNDYTKKDDYIDAKGIDIDKWKAKLGTGASSTDIQNLRNEVYEKIDNVKDEVRDVITDLEEVNPMLGHRGCRLAFYIFQDK